MNKNKCSQIVLRSVVSMLVLINLIACVENHSKEAAAKEEQAVLQVHKAYVEGWLKMDEEKILGLLEENARLQPSGLDPVKGKLAIQKFWFPKDSSITTINDYQTEIISLKVIDTLAISTHNSLLDWRYQKGTIRFGMLQKGINTTIYRKQRDDSWKIWRSMWTDYYFEQK